MFPNLKHNCYSLVVTVGFVIIGGYVMHYLVKMEEESVRKQLGAKVSHLHSSNNPLLHVVVTKPLLHYRD